MSGQLTNNHADIAKIEAEYETDAAVGVMIMRPPVAMVVKVTRMVAVFYAAFMPSLISALIPASFNPAQPPSGALPAFVAMLALVAMFLTVMPAAIITIMSFMTA